MHRDLVVVGAGFAGLACAKRAAERGLSVLVIEQQHSPGQHVHTTGILVEEAQAEWAAPPVLVRRLSRVRLYAPSHRHVDLHCNGYRFFATDTVALMRFLADDARRAGVEIRFGSPFTGATAANGSLLLHGHDIDCRFLVGADGVHSRVARATGLDSNVRLLKGVEWEYEPIERAGDRLHCFVDPDHAPGYIGWVVPGVGVTQVGLAVNDSRTVDIAGFAEHIDARFGLRGRRVLAKRGGMIPINGLLRRFHSDRVLLIGDAAGMVSANRRRHSQQLSLRKSGSRCDRRPSRTGRAESRCRGEGCLPARHLEAVGSMVLRQSARRRIHGTGRPHRGSIQAGRFKGVL